MKEIRVMSISESQFLHDGNNPLTH
jgi:hypothetical protein